MKHIILLILTIIPFLGIAQRQTAEEYKKKGTEEARVGNFDKAIELFTKSIQIDPTYAPAYNNRGIVKMQKTEYTDAVEDFTKAIDLDPTDHAFFFNRALTKAKMGEKEFAIEDYGLSLKIKPDDKVFLKKAVLEYELLQYDKALADIEQAIVLNDKEPDYFFYSGLIKLSSDNHLDGYNDLFKAAEMGHFKSQAMITDVFFDNIPKDKVFALGTRASMKFYKNDFKGAIADLDQLIKLSPKNGNAYMHRGVAKIHLEMKEEGCADLRKAVKLGCNEANVQLEIYCK